MLDKNISVEDILKEIDVATNKKVPLDPKSDLDEVNRIVEQILLEKKNLELQNEQRTINTDEREALEKEIKSQTKSIVKQYEKSKRESTKKLRKFQRDEDDINKELNITNSEWEESFSALYNDIESNSTVPLKLTTAYKEQTVKLMKPIEHITSALPNKQKIQAYVQSAHIDHIKKEAMNITSHFGDSSLEEKDDKKAGTQGEMTINNYRKLKQNRNKKISDFNLETTEENVKKIELEQDELNQNATTPKANKTETKETQQIQQEAYTEAENSYTLKTDEEKNRVSSMLTQKFSMSKISVLSLLALSILSVFSIFAKTATGHITILGSIVITPKLFAIANLVLLLMATIVSISFFKNVFKSFVTREPSRDILYLTTTIICLLSNIMLVLEPNQLLLNTAVHIYTPVLVISLLFNSISHYTIAKKARNNLNYILRKEEFYTVSLVENENVCSDMTKGVIEEEIFLAKNVKTQLFTNFIENSFKSNRSDEFCSKTCFFLLPLSLIIGISVFLLSKDLYVALSVFSGIMIISTTFIGGVLVSFPLNDTAKIIEHYAHMSPTSDSIIQLEDTNSILLDGYDLFPKGTVKLQGIKTFSGKRIDNAIIDAASVLCECKSALSHVFLDVIANNRTILKSVDSILYEDLMGISAWVDNKRVLIGNRDLMINHSIAVPKKEYEHKYQEIHQDVVYLATDGELCAAFIIGVTTKKSIYDAVNLLHRNQIKFVIKSVDALFTSEKICEIFDVQSDNFKLLPSRMHNAFINEHKTTERNDILVGNNGSLLGFIISLVTTKKLSSCINSGIVLNTFSIVLGIAMLCVLYFFDQFQFATPLTVSLYMGFFGIIYWLHQKNAHI